MIMIILMFMSNCLSPLKDYEPSVAKFVLTTCELVVGIIMPLNPTGTYQVLVYLSWYGNFKSKHPCTAEALHIRI